jgi:hypothetical protein
MFVHRQFYNLDTGARGQNAVTVIGGSRLDDWSVVARPQLSPGTGEEDI